MNRQTASKSRSIDALSPEAQRRLLEILERYLAGLEQGLPPDAEELVRRHPELSEPLRTCFSSLDFLHEASAPLRTAGQGPSADPDSSAKQLGEYGFALKTWH